MTLRAAFLALSLAVLSVATPVHAQSPGGAFCGTRTTRPPRKYAHVIWIWLENHSFADIVGSPDAPYINGTLIPGCGLATNFHNITHVSLPNYLGAVTGLKLADLQPFLLDCNPSVTCSTPADSIFAHVASWKAYEEAMPSNCSPANAGTYAVRHNPPVYLTSLPDCSTFDVPYTDLQADLDADTLPAFSFVTPDLCDDIHSCPTPSGDTWLAQNLPLIVASNAYQSGTTVVFVTFDEGSLGPMFSLGEDCAKNTIDESCHVPTIVISPYTRPGTTSSKLFNHYALLKTTQKLLGAGRLLGLARKSRSMRRAFHL
jgi:hypothetical protein